LEEFAKARVAVQLTQRFGFDLAYTFAGHAEVTANLLKGAWLAIGEAIAQLKDPALALRQLIKGRRDLLA
jgi:hypothetical protein